MASIAVTEPLGPSTSTTEDHFPERPDRRRSCKSKRPARICRAISELRGLESVGIGVPERFAETTSPLNRGRPKTRRAQNPRNWSAGPQG
jgi:hypothetical protein